MKPYFGEKIFRAFPLLIYIKLLITAILFNETHAIVFASFLFVCDGLNHGLKILLKSIMGEKVYPIIGSGMRPKGAKGCGLFYDPSPATSYGMPSGHTMFAGIVTAYILLNTFNGKFPQHDMIKGFIILGVIAMFLTIGESRIFLGCHTWPQVIIGGILGFTLGTFYYYNESKILEYLNIHN